MRKILLTVALLLTSVPMGTAFSMEKQISHTDSYFPDEMAPIKFTKRGLNDHINTQQHVIKTQYTYPEDRSNAEKAFQSSYANQLHLWLSEISSRWDGRYSERDGDNQSILDTTLGDVEIFLPGIEVSRLDSSTVWLNSTLLSWEIKLIYDKYNPITDGRVYKNYVQICGVMGMTPEAFFDKEKLQESVNHLTADVLSQLSALTEENTRLRQLDQTNNQSTITLASTQSSLYELGLQYNSVLDKLDAAEQHFQKASNCLQSDLVQQGTEALNQGLTTLKEIQ